MAKVIVYCDESGNTGPHYADPRQPFYALAAWAVPVDAMTDVAVHVETARKKYAPQQQDFSAANLLSSKWRQEGAIQLLGDLRKLGCIPLFEVMEKRFCIAAKIVETYLDSAFNPLVTAAITGDTITKIEVANSIYDRIPLDILNNFAAAFRAPTAENFGDSLSALSKAAQEFINPELANLLEGCRPHLADLAESEGDRTFFGNARAALNIPAFVGMMMMIERLARGGTVEPIKLVHDETAVYEEMFKKLHLVHKDANDVVFTYPNGAQVLMPLKFIPEFDTDSSTTSPFIQAADILAGTVVYMSKAANEGRELTEVERQLAQPIFAPLFIEEPRIAWTIGSDKWNAMLAKTCLTASTSLGAELRETQPAFPETLPVLPRNQQPAVLNAGPPRFPSHPVGIVNQRSRRLLIIDKSHGLMPFETTADRVVLLFSSRERAVKVLQALTGNKAIKGSYEVMEYNSLEEMLLLVEQLQAAMDHTSMLMLDWLTAVPADPIHLPRIPQILKAILSRSLRARATGMMDQIFQKEDYKGNEIHSLLSSGGNYTAVITDTFEMFRSATREDAIAQAKQSVDLRQG